MPRKKPTAYDPALLHVFMCEGHARCYERRRQKFVVGADGHPKLKIPDGVDYTSWHRLKTAPDDRIEEFWGLVEVRPTPQT